MTSPNDLDNESLFRLDRLIPRLSEIYTMIRSGADDSRAQLETLAEEINRLTTAAPDATLAGIHLSGQHSPLKQPIYCAAIACLFGKQHQLSISEQKTLLHAVLLCNITFYEFQVLLNTMDGKLSEAQIAKLHKHPLESAQLMENAGFRDPLLSKAIRQHHERPDGSGYPNRLLADDICELALMVAMCEVYTARIDNRAYRKPVLAREALAPFKNDTNRSKTLMLSFAKAVGIYPPGTWIRLNSGEIALAVQRQANSPIPIVRALFDASGEPYMGPINRDCSQPQWKILEAVARPKTKLRVDLNLLFARGSKAA